MNQTMILSKELNQRWLRKSALKLTSLCVKLPEGQYFPTIPASTYLARTQTSNSTSPTKAHPLQKSCFTTFCACSLVGPFRHDAAPCAADIPSSPGRNGRHPLGKAYTNSPTLHCAQSPDLVLPRLLVALHQPPPLQDCIHLLPPLVVLPCSLSLSCFCLPSDCSSPFCYRRQPQYVHVVVG